MEATTRRRNRRMEDLRTTAEERDLIDCAVAVTGGDLTEFVVTHAYQAAQRVLAERDRFELGPSAATEWEEINQLPPGPGPARAAPADGPPLAVQRVTPAYRPAELLAEHLLRLVHGPDHRR